MSEITAESLMLHAQSVQEERDKLRAENKALLEDYQKAVGKFDNCRGCLARIAEKLNIELPNEAPKGVAEWHEHLIFELDKWNSREKESK